MNRINRKEQFEELLDKHGANVFGRDWKYHVDVYEFPIALKDQLMTAFHLACDTSVPDSETLVDCFVSSSYSNGKFTLVGRSTDYDGFVEHDSDRSYGSDAGGYLYIYPGTRRYYKGIFDEYERLITLYDSYADGTKLPIVVCFK